MRAQVGASIGELLDKLTILEIKLRVIKDTTKWQNCQKEWFQLSTSIELIEKGCGIITNTALADELTYQYFKLINGLRATNQKLWDIEDELREMERNKIAPRLESYLERGVKPIIQEAEFYRAAKRFVELARAVYHTNDERCRIKKEIDALLGSEFTEEKSYKEYRS